MKIDNLFSAFKEVVREVDPFVLEQRFLRLCTHDQQLILCVAMALMKARPDMTEFMLEQSANVIYDNLPEC